MSVTLVNVATYTITITERERAEHWDDGVECGVLRADVVVNMGDKFRHSNVFSTVAAARTYADGVFTGLRIAHPDSTVVLNEVSRETVPERFAGT